MDFTGSQFARDAIRAAGLTDRQGQRAVLGVHRSLMNKFGPKANPMWRWGPTLGLGFIALRSAGTSLDRLRHGRVGGAMVSAAVAAGAGYGAYQIARMNQTTIQNFTAQLAKQVAKKLATK